MDNNIREVKSIELCKHIKDKVADEMENYIIVSDSAQIKSKVTLDSIIIYNKHLATQRGSDKSNLFKILRDMNVCTKG